MPPKPFAPHPLKLTTTEEKLELIDYLSTVLRTKIHRLNVVLADPSYSIEAKTRILPEIVTARHELAAVSRKLAEVRAILEHAPTRH